MSLVTHSSFFNYKRTKAKMVETVRAMITGKKLFRTRSITEIFAKPAIAIIGDQTTSVPPPTHIALI